METMIAPVTADMLSKMPDDGFSYELIKGEPVREPSPQYQHGRVTGKIGPSLAIHVQSNGLGVYCAAETGFLLASDPDTVRAPDAAFIRQERIDQQGDVEGYWPGAPDLAVEVISPSDTYTKVEEKVFQWLDAGAQMVVVVNPRVKSVSVYHSRQTVTILTEDETLDGGEVVPGWRLPVKEIFA